MVMLPVNLTHPWRPGRRRHYPGKFPAFLNESITQRAFAGASGTSNDEENRMRSTHRAALNK